MPFFSSTGGSLGFGRAAQPPATGFVTSGLFMNLDASDPASYPGSGTTWTDLTGNGNNGTLTGGASYSSTLGSNIVFTSSSQYVSIPHKSQLSAKTSAPITISLWIRLTALENISYISKLTGSYGFDGYFVGQTTAGYMNSTTNGTGIDKRLNSSPTVVFAINTWYMVTFITQITATANSTKGYVNTTLAYQGAHGSDSISESNPLLLGLGQNRIGAVYFYTRELSLAEITRNFNATRTRFGV